MAKVVFHAAKRKLSDAIRIGITRTRPFENWIGDEPGPGGRPFACVLGAGVLGEVYGRDGKIEPTFNLEEAAKKLWPALVTTGELPKKIAERLCVDIEDVAASNYGDGEVERVTAMDVIISANDDEGKRRSTVANVLEKLGM